MAKPALKWSLSPGSRQMRADLPFEDVLVTLIRRLMDVGLIAPSRCPNGHRLGANQVLVGDVACLCHGGGHTSWHCRTCDAVVVYGPPLNTHCTALDGPASVRISSSRR